MHSRQNGLSAMFAGDLTPEEAAENIQAAYEEQAASYHKETKMEQGFHRV